MLLRLDLHSKYVHIPAIMINITPKQLRKAADIQERIQSLQEELSQLLGSEVPTPAQTSEAPRKRKKVSAAGRARMRAAQIARWAKIKGTAPSIEPATEPKRKQLSEAKLNALAKARAARMAKTKAAQEKPKKKRKMSAAWRKALERAWAARRAKAAQKA